MQSKSIHVIYHIYIHVYIYISDNCFTILNETSTYRSSVKACSASFSSHAPNSAQGCADSKGQIVNLDALITSYIITIYHNIQRENLKDSCFWLFSPWKNHASHSIHRWSRCKVKWAIGLASASYIWGTALTLHSTEQSFSKVSITVFQNVSNILEFRWGYG